MKTIIEKLITASKELQEIPVKGQDTLRMATALTLIEQAVQELYNGKKEMAKAEQEKKEETECLSE